MVVAAEGILRWLHSSARAHSFPWHLFGPGAVVGAYCASAFADWRALTAPEELAAEAGIPEPGEASKLRAVRLPGLLTAGEIAGLLALGEEIRTTGQATLHRTGISALAVVHSQDMLHSVETSERQVPPSQWQTTYLHFGHQFQGRLGPLREKLRQAALSVDSEHWGICSSAATAASATPARGSACANIGSDIPEACDVAELINLRTVELHSVAPGGALPQRDHYDAGSCVTIDVMLSQPGIDFVGGELELPVPALVREGLSHGTPESTDVHSPVFEQGDALIFPSHKYHCVKPVTAGLRQVLVIELWCGEERSCPHRCERHWGRCSCGGQQRMQDRFRRLLQAAMADGPVSPW